MRKILVFILATVFIFSNSLVFAGGAEPTNEELLKEIKALKARVLELETKLMKQEEKVKKTETQTKEIQDKFEHLDTHVLHREEGIPAFISEGFKIGAGATMVVQGTDEINADNITRHNAATDASYSADLEIEKEFEDYGKAFFHLEAGKGQGIEDELKLYSNVNIDALDNENIKLAEAWYEHYFGDWAILTFGKLDSTVYFDGNAFANDETTQFLGRIFRNSPTIEFPDYTAGIRLALAPVEYVEIDLGYFDGDADWEDILDEGFYIGQVNLKPNFFDRPGNYRLLGWISDRNHTKWSDATNTQEEAYGLGISFDQELTDSLGAFVRYGWQDPEQRLNGLTNDFSLAHAWSTGLQLKGNLWSRDDDVVGLAIGQAIPSDDYKDSSPILAARKELHFEGYYNYKVNDHLTISPDIQIICNPYGRDASEGDDTISVYGMRAQIDF